MTIQLNNGSTMPIDWTWMEEQQQRAIVEDVVESICLECGEHIEIDSDELCGHCFHCNEVCDVWNPLDHI